MPGTSCNWDPRTARPPSRCGDFSCSEARSALAAGSVAYGFDRSPGFSMRLISIVDLRSRRASSATPPITCFRVADWKARWRSTFRESLASNVPGAAAALRTNCRASVRAAFWSRADSWLGERRNSTNFGRFHKTVSRGGRTLKRPWGRERRPVPAAPLGSSAAAGPQARLAHGA
jgi:hypothetical protein